MALLGALGISGSEMRALIAPKSFVRLEPEAIFTDILNGLTAGTMSREFFRVIAFQSAEGSGHELSLLPDRVPASLRDMNAERYREFDRRDFRSSLMLCEDWMPGRITRYQAILVSLKEVGLIENRSWCISRKTRLASIWSWMATCAGSRRRNWVIRPPTASLPMTMNVSPTTPGSAESPPFENTG